MSNVTIFIQICPTKKSIPTFALIISLQNGHAFFESMGHQLHDGVKKLVLR
jgi:hypothetical protein